MPAAVAAIDSFGKGTNGSLNLHLRPPQSIHADAPYGAAATVRQWQQASTLRLLAMTGSDEELAKALQDLSILGRRLQQSSSLVVVVPRTGSKLKLPRHLWLAAANWQDYFEALSPDSGFRWFGLSAVGRSLGSGQTIPSWLQLLGQRVRPTDLLDESDNGAAAVTDKTQH